MRLPDALTSDIPFARDDAQRMLPAMIGCLAAFAALLLAIAMTLSGTLSAQSKDVRGVIEVELPAQASKSLIDQSVAQLQATEGVEEVTVLNRDDEETLLKPWLGQHFSLGDLPVPILVDVKTKVNGEASVVDLDALGNRLRKLDSSIRLQDRGPWVDHMVRAVTLLQGLVFLIAGLLVACMLGMIVLVARTNLKLHFKTVSLLHLFGATDEYILRQFQWNGALLAARGAIAGVLFAALVFGAAVLLTHHWASPVLPPLDFGVRHAVVFLTLPVFVSLTALLATRLTVQSMLHHIH